jgi:hypothetical protein
MDNYLLFETCNILRAEKKHLKIENDNFVGACVRLIMELWKLCPILDINNTHV